MSCFIVSSEQINYILNGIKYWDSVCFWEEHQKYQNDKDLNRIGKILMKNNFLAYNARYVVRKEENLELWKEIRDFKFQSKPHPIEREEARKFLAQTIKFLQCLHYQCCEGKIADNSITKWIEEIDKEISAYYVREFCNFDEFKWSI